MNTRTLNVPKCRLVNALRDVSEIRRYVMFEAFAANVLEKPL
jgi:hypothetical protein